MNYTESLEDEVKRLIAVNTMLNQDVQSITRRNEYLMKEIEDLEQQRNKEPREIEIRQMFDQMLKEKINLEDQLSLIHHECHNYIKDISHLKLVLKEIGKENDILQKEINSIIYSFNSLKSIYQKLELAYIKKKNMLKLKNKIIKTRKNVNNMIPRR